MKMNCFFIFVTLFVVALSSALLESEQQFWCDFASSTNVGTIYTFWTCENAQKACTYRQVVQCDTDGHITSLIVSNVALIGTIPTSINLLTQLSYLDFSNTGLTGSIPAQIGDLSQLKILLLDNTNLTGVIPSTITKLSNMETFIMPDLISTLPDDIGALTNLRSLLLIDGIYGTLPSSIGALEKLEFLHIHGTKLVGTIPSSINQLSNLQFLSISDNGFTGSIPNGFAGLSSLGTLVLQENDLTGFLQLSSFTKLQDLDITNTDVIQLCGCIPSNNNLRRCELLNVITRCDCKLPPICPPVRCSDQICTA